MSERKFSRFILGKRGGSKLSLALRFFLFFALFSFFGGFAGFIFLARDLPRPEKFTEKQFYQSSKIYDKTGRTLLYDVYGEEKRTVVPLSQIPNDLKNAVLAAEDNRFYSHSGIDFRSVIRSILYNLKTGKPTYGGSTISQQLIRSTFLTSEKTLARKLKELVLTIELERRYSKDQILEWYLNQIPLGGNIYGVQASSTTYFGKDVSQISASQAAMIAALIKAPGYLYPYNQNPRKEELLARRDYVISRMEKLDYLSQKDAENASKEEMKFSEISQPIKAPHFVMYVKDLLLQKYSEDFLKTAGLKIYTSLDWGLQNFAEKTVESISKINEAYYAFNAALVSINPKSGEILAMIGSKDWFGKSFPEKCESGLNCLFEPKYNIATGSSKESGRQPGSAFKPFAYAAAFNKGYSPETILTDEKTEFNPNCDPLATQEKDEYGLDCYHPENYDGKFRGPVTLRQSLALSLNVPSVKVLSFAGLPETIDLASKMGITTLTDPSRFGLSLVLGGGEVKLLDITSSYGVFANNGLKISPVAILKIEDSQGNTIEENKKTPQRVLEANVAHQISSILSDNETRSPIFGWSSPLFFPDYDVAVKTGTTQDYKDGWVVGYSPSVVTGVWVGNNDGTLMNKEPGVVLAGPIFHTFMEYALNKFSKEFFIKPDLSPLVSR